jgi:hypothetical protein
MNLTEQDALQETSFLIIFNITDDLETVKIDPCNSTLVMLCSGCILSVQYEAILWIRIGSLYTGKGKC